MIETKGIYLSAFLLALLGNAACSEDTPKPTHDEMMERKMAVTKDHAVREIERVEIPQEELQAGIDPGVPNEVLDEITVDAAKRAKTVEESVRIIMAQKETWSDGAMGCPMPDESYTQMQTTGFHVVAVVGLQKFDYRVAENGRFKLCDPMRIKKPMPTQ